MPSANEFSIIEQYFLLKSQSVSHSDVLQSIGDDCAVVAPQPGKKLLFSMDTLIEGVHFPTHTSPENIAYKALAANLSDLAAMGAKPAWFTLALSLPENDPEWLEAFSSALLELAQSYQIQLIGGDTTRSPSLSITIQVHGYVKDKLLLRHAAQIGDIIGITGQLGAAALGLQLQLQPQSYSDMTLSHQQQALAALHRPQARIAEGQLLSEYGSRCAIDISDGLCADLGHILQQSSCGAIIDVDKIPMATCLQSLEKNLALKMALTGGDDYQLCFTISKQHYLRLCAERDSSQFTIVGQIVAGEGLQLMKNNQPYNGLTKQPVGYNHFG